VDFVNRSRFARSIIAVNKSNRAEAHGRRVDQQNAQPRYLSVEKADRATFLKPASICRAIFTRPKPACGIHDL